MSYELGWAALNLEMPERVPRTEYSLAEYHFPLIERVTGLRVTDQSTGEEKHRARRALREAWTFDLSWNTCIYAAEFGDVRTKMGHASYSSSGSDYSSETSLLYENPEDALSFDP